MSRTFKDAIIACSKEFTSTNEYRTITRRNGHEIITVIDNKVLLTNLIPNGSEKTGSSTIDLIDDLNFMPSEILLNETEELCCIYNHSNIWLFSLTREGSKFSFSVTYKIDLTLQQGTQIIQVVFNNKSKYSSEIVVLTNHEILTYNINISLKEYVQRVALHELNTGAFDYESSIVDPVSICFGSSKADIFSDSKQLTPQDDITLYLLTSDASIYKIFPFFPSELSVSKEWLSDLFDLTTLTFKTVEDEIEQSKLLSSVKVAALLQNTRDPLSIVIENTIPAVYRRGKLVGPLCLESFPEDLYAQNAIKLLALPNGVMVIVFDHSVVVFSTNHGSRMIFEHQTGDTEDSFQLLETLFFDEKHGSIDTATAHPVSNDSIFLTASNGSVIQVDFSQWMSLLSSGLETGDLSEFSKLCESERLPTEIINLGKMNLPKEESLDSSVHLRSHENQIWFAWNTRDVFAMVVKKDTEDILSMFLISVAVESKYEEGEYDNGKTKVCEDSLYKSELVRTFEEEDVPQIKKSLQKITEITLAMKKCPTIILNEDETTLDDLKVVHNFTELVSAGQLILYKVLSILSKRLKMLSVEYHQQLTAYHTVMMKKEKILQNYLKLKNAFLEAKERQDQLLVKMAKVMNNTEILEAKGNMKSVSISYQENAYFKELSRMRDYVIRKERELKELNELVSNVKNAEDSVLLKNKEELLNDYHNRRSLAVFRQNLASQKVFIDTLVERINSFQLD